MLDFSGYSADTPRGKLVSLMGVFGFGGKI
jgi:hypothetical protein